MFGVLLGGACVGCVLICSGLMVVWGRFIYWLCLLTILRLLRRHSLVSLSLLLHHFVVVVHVSDTYALVIVLVIVERIKSDFLHAV